MEYREGIDLGQSQVNRGGGGGRGRGPIAVGGGIGGIIMLVLMLLFGGNLGDVLGQQPAEPQPQQTGSNECKGKVDIEQNRDCRWDAYDVALQTYWSKAVQGFTPASEQLFSGQAQTACGTGSSEMGPFYCPGDKTIYIDTEFMQQLFQQLGAAGGDAAELYVVAHEYGHHISNLTGQMQKGQADRETGPKSGQVRLELQADCYAGVFFKNTMADQNSPIKTVTKDDLLRIADAAKSVGDDHIQQQQQGRVVPESWTHGSSEMRQRWVAKGFDSGNPKVCDTFATNDL